MNSLANACGNNGIASCNSKSSPAMASPTKSGRDASACPILTKLGPSRVTALRICLGAPPAALALLPLLLPNLSEWMTCSAAKANKTPKNSTTTWSRTKTLFGEDLLIENDISLRFSHTGASSNTNAVSQERDNPKSSQNGLYRCLPIILLEKS